MVFTRFIVVLFKRLEQHHVFLYAGGLAFSLLLCIIPLIFIVFWLLGSFIDVNNIEEQVQNLIDAFIPYADYADYAKGVLLDRIEELIAGKNIAGIIGIGGLIFAASSFLASLRTVLNKVFEYEKPMNLLLSKLIDILLIFVIIVGFSVAMLVLPLLVLFRQLYYNIPFFRGIDFLPVDATFTIVASFLIVFIGFAFVYKIIPDKKISNRSALAGSFYASALWVMAKEFFGVYLYNFASYGQIYGTYALGIVICFWIYYTAIVFIVGAEIARLYEENAEIFRRYDQIFKIRKLNDWLDKH
ncbi:MAG: YihY/virulence factor BrkB family protein [Ignavibacteriaceae bacterium]|nr:YihY/virulence factor BrkB family protein [Ignavibacteriaceae bacterium]NUM70194.1 YihY/virulence factor BrkB family protein [Ignavibacteriaceae bacterium]